ncbi:MAG: hypothetical protein LKE51_09565 [Selenomonas sp.]|nr:hypothetical protein [Selenomonas sp.]
MRSGFLAGLGNGRCFRSGAQQLSVPCPDPAASLLTGKRPPADEVGVSARRAAGGRTQGCGRCRSWMRPP